MFNKSSTGAAYVTKFATTNSATTNTVIKSTDGDIRDLRVENVALRKELLRKDTRNDKISKELNNSRINCSNCQRDLRILTGTFDKVNNERHNLTNEVFKAKEYIDKLEQQLARLADTHTISSQNVQYRIDIDNLTNEINQIKQKGISKDEYIKSLERDLSILRKSIDIQMESEKHMLKGPNNQKEIMRSLYYELGKRQTDAHGLAISLSESHKANDTLKKDNNELNKYNSDLENNLKELSNQINDVKNQNNLDNNEIAILNQRIVKMNDLNNHLQNQIEDISKKSSESLAVSVDELNNKNNYITNMELKLQDYNDMKKRMVSLQQSLQQMDSVNQLSEQRIKTEWEIIQSEKELMKERLKQGDGAIAQVELLRKSLTDALESKEDLFRNLETLKSANDYQNGEEKEQINALKIQLNETEKYCATSRSHEKRLTIERDDAMKALLQTVEATRELSSRYQNERKKRILAEEKSLEAVKLADNMKKTKEHVSVAVLDALHKERSKNAVLEQALNSLSNHSSYNHNYSHNSSSKHHNSSNNHQNNSSNNHQNNSSNNHQNNSSNNHQNNDQHVVESSYINNVTSTPISQTSPSLSHNSFALPTVSSYLKQNEKSQFHYSPTPPVPPSPNDRPPLSIRKYSNNTPEKKNESEITCSSEKNDNIKEEIINNSSSSSSSNIESSTSLVANSINSEVNNINNNSTSNIDQLNNFIKTPYKDHSPFKEVEGTPVISIMADLRRLRDELQKIEETTPSPLSQSSYNNASMQENPFKSNNNNNNNNNNYYYSNNNNNDDDSQSHIFGNLSSSTIESSRSNNYHNGTNKYSNISSQSSVIELAANILYNDATR